MDRKRLPGEVNVEEWAKQADSYEEIRDGKTWDKFLQIVATANLDHPFAAVRVREIMKWCDTPDFQDARKYIHEHYATKIAVPVAGPKSRKTGPIVSIVTRNFKRSCFISSNPINQFIMKKEKTIKHPPSGRNC